MGMEKLVELTIRVFADYDRDKKHDAIALIVQTPDNTLQLMNGIAAIHKTHPDMLYLVNGSESISGYAGFKQYQTLLLNKSIDEKQILKVPPVDKNILHTRNESEAIVRFAKRMNFETLGVMAAPFHQLRAFMSVVTLCLLIYPELKIYSIPGSPADWTEKVSHSQGLLNDSRNKLIHSEIQRITTYQEKGDLASTEEVLEYLNNRDIS
ncbi:MAG: YdcF family protein [Bacteroidota bacterium]